MIRGPVTALALGVAVVALWFSRTTVLLVLLAILVAIALDGFAAPVRRMLRAPRPLAVAIVLLIIAGCLSGLVIARGDTIAGQFAQLGRDLPNAVAELRLRLGGTALERWIATTLASAANGIPAIAGIAARAGFIVTSTLGGIVSAAFVVFVAFWLALEPQLYFDGALRLVPAGRRKRVRAVLEETATILRTWLLARLISMAALGTLVTIGLSLLKIPLAGTLGVLAGLLAFVPNAGAIVAAVPAILIAVTVDLRLAALVAVVYWIAHTVDDLIVIPVAERTVVKLPPALTVTAQLLLGVVAGILGVMLAAPLTAAAIHLVRRLLVEDVLERGTGSEAAFSEPG
jgi:predicted PurR-regulated permease PerM